MNTPKSDNLACPIDGQKLRQQDRQLVCENGHSFDIARQGYVNLLPVQHKRSKQPGDSKAMVVARTAFLDSGVYEPIARQLTEIVLSQLNGEDDYCLLDAGCGEGYYFDIVYKAINEQITGELTGLNTVSFIGLDISKDAIIHATKRNKQISWIVGTNRHPPVKDESVDIILCLFGFLSIEGFSRILKPGGRIILVDPGPEHLKELREIIYAEVRKQGQTDSQFEQISGFDRVDKKVLRYNEKLHNNEQVNNLLIMTPHFYRASKEGREHACALTELDITIDVVFRILQKT